ncbi:MAG TPA: ABC transporter substrate-binding protein [Patescibacteria group bacterium]|nr:ABC transporter substrate-binding protein [Patescibacteria group bacterium]
MAKSLRYWIRLTLAFFDRFKLIFLFGIIIGIVCFVLFGIIESRMPIAVEKIGIVGEYTSDNLPRSITDLISVGLTTVDVSGEAQSGIAQSFIASDSGKTWTFNLNKNLYWQDGSQVTSHDINYNFSDATLSKPDKYTVVFKLKTGLASFPVTLSKPIFKSGLLGTGDWKVVNLTLAGNYVDTISLENKQKQEKIFKFYPTSDAARLGYELGEINDLTNLVNPKPFDTWNVASISGQINKQQYVAVFFNNSDSLLTDKDIRQALSYAIDKSDYKNNRALGPISPFSWAYDPSVKPYDFDITHAKDLIDGSKIDPSLKKNLKITLTTIPDLLDLANKIANDWKQIGVQTTVQVLQFVPDPSQYQAYLAITNIPLDPDQYLNWHSTQTSTNITQLKDPRIDKLLEDGRLETDETKRKAIYFDFQKYLVEDAPAAFLYYPTYFNVAKK